MMTGNAAALLLVPEGAEASEASRALLQQAAGSCSSLPLPHFLSSSPVQSSAYETVFLSLNAANKNAAVAAASKLLSVLKADGLLVAAVEGKDYSETLAEFGRACLYAGFVSVDLKDVPAGLQSKAENEQAVHLAAWKRPPWAVGASVAVGGVAEGLIDEDSLIDPSDTYKAMAKGRSDCASRPRACANCTCGRKEAEEAADKEAFKKMLESGAVRSSCGNCYLGDAFRCAGCPYKGLPAFRPGQKVDLSKEMRGGAETAVVAALAAAAPDAPAAAGVSVAQGTNKVTLASLDDDC